MENDGPRKTRFALDALGQRIYVGATVAHISFGYGHHSGSISKAKVLALGRYDDNSTVACILKPNSVRKSYVDPTRLIVCKEDLCSTLK